MSTFVRSEEVSVQVESFRGPEGKVGPQGIQGPQGEAGATGAKGPTGDYVRVSETSTGVKITQYNGASGMKIGEYYINNGTDTTVDSTLTQAGQAADAKATGDALNSLNEEMANQPTSKPRVFIKGNIPTTKENVLAEMQYTSPTLNFHAYIKIKCQGSSSMAYPKKNFTVTLYQDEARSIPMSIMFPGWKYESNKFVLKANWIDHSHARNIVSANLWSEIVASRPDYDTLPEELRNSPNNGAVDGFPIIVYTNGHYQGIYTWNIGKDDWMWGMDEGNPNHVLMCGEINDNGEEANINNPCNFRTLWDGVSGSYWSVEVGTNSDAVKNSLNALIACVMDTTDEEFRTQIGNYLDIQSAICYYIFAYADCGIDSLAKNMLLGTYDLRKWYMGAYDLDSTWGLFWDGSSIIPATTSCPSGYMNKYSLLWEKIVRVFDSEIKERKAELRESVLSDANVLLHFEQFVANVSADAYADDLVPYPNIPSNAANNIRQLRDFVPNRLSYFDLWLADRVLLYNLDTPAEIDGVESAIVTDVMLADQDKDFTIAVDFTAAELETDMGIWSINSKNPSLVRFLRLTYNKTANAYRLQTAISYEKYYTFDTDLPIGSAERNVVMVRHKAGSGFIDVTTHSNQITTKTSKDFGMLQFPSAEMGSVYIGANYGWDNVAGMTILNPFHGYVNRFEIYGDYLSDQEVTAFIDGMTD